MISWYRGGDLFLMRVSTHSQNGFFIHTGMSDIAVDAKMCGFGISMGAEAVTVPVTGGEYELALHMVKLLHLLPVNNVTVYSGATLGGDYAI